MTREQELDEDVESNEDRDISSPVEGATAENRKMDIKNVESTAAALTVHQAATQALDFLQPFLEELHSEHVSKV